MPLRRLTPPSPRAAPVRWVPGGAPLCLSSDGQRIAVGTSGGLLTVWADGTEPVSSAQAHDGPVIAVAFSRGRLISLSAHSLRVDGQHVALEGEARAMAVWPDQESVLIAAGGIWRWTAADGLTRLSEEGACSLAALADGSFAADSGDTVRWLAPDGTERSRQAYVYGRVEWLGVTVLGAVGPASVLVSVYEQGDLYCTTTQVVFDLEARTITALPEVPGATVLLMGDRRVSFGGRGPVEGVPHVASGELALTAACDVPGAPDQVLTIGPDGALRTWAQGANAQTEVGRFVPGPPAASLLDTWDAARGVLSRWFLDDGLRASPLDHALPRGATVVQLPQNRYLAVHSSGPPEGGWPHGRAAITEHDGDGLPSGLQTSLLHPGVAKDGVACGYETGAWLVGFDAASGTRRSVRLEVGAMGSAVHLGTGVVTADQLGNVVARDLDGTPRWRSHTREVIALSARGACNFRVASQNCGDRLLALVGQNGAGDALVELDPAGGQTSAEVRLPTRIYVDAIHITEEGAVTSSTPMIVWRRGQAPRVIPGSEGLWAVCAHPDGHWALAIDFERRVRLLHVADGRLEETGVVADLDLRVAFGTDTVRIATADGRGAVVGPGVPTLVDDQAPPKINELYGGSAPREAGPIGASDRLAVQTWPVQIAIRPGQPPREVVSPLSLVTSLHVFRGGALAYLRGPCDHAILRFGGASRTLDPVLFHCRAWFADRRHLWLVGGDPSTAACLTMEAEADRAFPVPPHRLSALSNEGMHLALADATAVIVLATAQGEEVGRLSIPDVAHLAWQDRWLVAASAQGEIAVFDAMAGVEVGRITHGDTIREVAFPRSDRVAVLGGFGDPVIYALDAEQPPTRPALSSTFDEFLAALDQEERDDVVPWYELLAGLNREDRARADAEIVQRCEAEDVRVFVVAARAGLEAGIAAIERCRSTRKGWVRSEAARALALRREPPCAR